MDRGPASESNLVLLRHLRYHVITGLPQKGQWASLIEKVSAFEIRFNLKGTRFESRVLPVHIEGHRFFVHIYFNHKNAQKEQLQRLRALRACKKQLESLRLGQYQLKTYQKIRGRIDEILQKQVVSL